MNCPYCDQGIPAGTKFCPKCGLPLQDDATVMGGYTAPASSMPDKRILIAGGAGLGVILLAMGLLAMNQSSTRDRAGRQSTKGYFATTATPAGTPTNAVAMGMARSAPPLTLQPAPQATSYAPPPPAPSSIPAPFVMPRIEFFAPPVPLAIMELQRPRRQATVSTPRPVRPPTPGYVQNEYPTPAVQQASAALPLQGTNPLEFTSADEAGLGMITPIEGTGGDYTSGGSYYLGGASRTGALRSRRSRGRAWVWDPVMERYVVDPGRG
jgi:hypothetical protein